MTQPKRTTAKARMYDRYAEGERALAKDAKTPTAKAAHLKKAEGYDTIANNAEKRADYIRGKK